MRAKWPVDRAVEAFTAIRVRPVRALLTALATAVGVAAYIALAGTSAMTERDVRERFDRLRPDIFRVSPSGEERDPLAVFSADGLSSLRRLEGIHGAAVLHDLRLRREVHVSASWDPARTGQAVSVDAIVAPARGDLERTLGAPVISGRWFDDGHVRRGDRVAVVGRALATQLDLRVRAEPSVVIVGDQAFAVIGIAGGLRDFPELLDAVMVPDSTVAHVWGRGALASTRMQVRTTRDLLGRAAAQAPLALRPEAPLALTVAAPPDPSGLRADVTGQVAALVLLVSLISLGTGLLVIGASTLVAVMERRVEIGLRRALGAHARDIATQFLMEAGYIGALGGILGAAGGAAIVAGRALQLGTAPLFDPMLLLLAPLAGLAAGWVAGLLPALRATRIEPSEAIRA